MVRIPTTDEQLATLPKYARQEIELLRRRVANLTDQVYQLRKPYHPDDEYYYTDYVDGDRVDFPVPLGEYIPLHVKLDNGSQLSIGKVEGDGNKLYIRGDTDIISVLPVVANVIEVTTRKRFGG